MTTQAWIRVELEARKERYYMHFQSTQKIADDSSSADLYITKNFLSLGKSDFYVQLSLSLVSRKDAENNFKTQFPDSTVVTFYQRDSCMQFLESVVDAEKLGHATLLLHTDDANLDDLLDEFERIDSIKKIYLCSKSAPMVNPRRILYGRFANEDELYTQLCCDHLLWAFIQTNQQIKVFKNKREATRYVEETQHFHKLLQQHVDRERKNSEF